MKFLAILIVHLLACNVVFAATAPTTNCVLDGNGIESCTTALATLPVAERQAVPCEKTDMECWCLKATEYTNDVRRRRGQQKKLKVGPVKQLENAVRYARVLGDLGRLRHQRLRDATNEIGCARFIGGENIAYNYEKRDVAKACVDQWESSQGHLENILRDSFAEVVVGFYFDPNGRVYCVQTFTLETSYGTVGSRSDPGCEAVGAGSGPKPTKPVPTEPTTTKPAPTEPTTTKPAPTEPTTTKPAPTEPTTTKPAPTEPTTTKPATTEPTKPASTKPTQPAPTEPEPTEPAPTKPPVETRKITLTLRDRRNNLWDCRCTCRPKIM